MQTGYEYYPLHEGVTHEYDVYEITGHLVQISTGQVLQTIPANVFDYRPDILTRVPHANSPQYMTYFHDADFKTFGALPFFGSYFTYSSENRMFDRESMLTSFGVAWDGQQQMPYIGEIRSQLGQFTIPPLPLLTKFPRVGQVLDIHSSVYEDNNVTTPDYPSSLYVLEHCDIRGQWRDVWLTVLTERGGSMPVVYEYAFARGIGIVDLWYGGLENGIVTGYEYGLKNVIKGIRS